MAVRVELVCVARANTIVSNSHCSPPLTSLCPSVVGIVSQFPQNSVVSVPFLLVVWVEFSRTPPNRATTRSTCDPAGGTARGIAGLSAWAGALVDSSALSISPHTACLSSTGSGGVSTPGRGSDRNGAGASCPTRANASFARFDNSAGV